MATKIKAVNENKSPDLDGLPVKLLIETVQKLAHHLKREWFLLNGKNKHHTTIKKMLQHKSEHYRPVSLTPVIYKLLQRLIKDHIMALYRMYTHRCTCIVHIRAQT